MMEMNLLPKEYRKKPVSRFLLLFILLLCLAIWPAVKLGYYLPLDIKAEKAKQLASLKAETNLLPEMEENYELQMADLEGLHKRVLAFQRMEESSPEFWQNVMQVLTESLPYGTTIKDFTCDNDTIKLTGTSSSDINSAKYLRNLQNSGLFSDVCMENIQYSNKGEVRFYLSCNLVSDEVEKEETEVSVP